MTNGHHATKNGHPILMNGNGFDDGRRVSTQMFDYDQSDKEFMEEQREIGRREVQAEKVSILRLAMAIIRHDTNPLFGCDAFSFAVRETEATLEEIADKYGATKQAASKRVKQWREFLDLPPLGPMRTDKARQTFKKTTTESWKKLKQRESRNSHCQSVN